ncbi:MAG: DUF3310 domain-containing protein [Microbacterium gubbeenense]|uniref:DUF3310 domain-containing protein n=1 Tax=Microbacterium gubbeenense TaxID=159896 RepID=UPI003F9A3CFD
MTDAVNHPAHYNLDPSGIECIQVARHRNFDIGNAFKYLWRLGLKKAPDREAIDSEIQDAEKAIWYIQDHITELRRKKKNAALDASRLTGHSLLGNLRSAMHEPCDRRCAHGGYVSGHLPVYSKNPARNA